MSSSSNPFEAMISSNVVPKSVAILPKVSPSCTVYSVKVGLGVGVVVGVGVGVGVGVEIGVGVDVGTTVGVGLAGLGRGKAIVSVGASTCVNVLLPSSGS